MRTDKEPDARGAQAWQEVFSTQAFAARERLDAFRETFAVPFGGVQVSKLGEAPFRVSVSVAQVGPLACARFVASPTLFERTRRLMGDGDDSILLLICNSGRLGFWQRDVRHELQAGEMGVVGNGEPRGGVVDGDGLALQIPQAALTRLLPQGAWFSPGMLPESGPYTRLLLRYVQSFLDPSSGGDARLDEVIARHVIDLLALALDPQRDAQAPIGRGGVRAARLQAIKAEVRAGVGVADLSVSAVARRHGVSPRYVQMLFEREGATFSEFVLAERLQRAYELLADRANLNLKVSDIAYRVGFSDLSHFNRTFRQRFGIVPSDARGAT